MALKAREDRIRDEREVKLIEGDQLRYVGLTRDLSNSGFSAFLAPAASREAASLSAVSRHLTPQELSNLFAKKQLGVVIELAAPLGPVACQVIRVENSWRKGYQVFVAARFLALSADEEASLRNHVQSRTSLADAEPVHVPLRPQERIPEGEGDQLHFRFPGRYFYLAHFRNLCERLALEVGFSEMEAYKIKVAFDEVLTNAFKHGCIEYGKDIIDIKLNLDRDGFFVCVRDPAGRSFNYERYKHFDEQFPNTSRTGLHLVDKFTDGWMVNTKPGQYTEVSFYKRRESEAGE